jgi:brefeldin A-resistance guanine nucleotide exchange factor 1
MAMRATHNFLMYGYINASSSSRPDAAVRLIVSSVVSREEYTDDHNEEEIACMTTLEVLLQCLTSSVGHLLPDGHVSVMARKCMEIRNKRGASQLLRKFAENTLMQMVLVVFGRLNPETGAGGHVIDAPLSSSSSSATSSTSSPSATSSTSSSSATSSTSSPFVSDAKSSRPTQLTTSSHRSSTSNPARGSVSYGVGSMVDLLRYLARLIDPNPNLGDANSEKDRCFGLSLLRTVWETTGPHISEFPRLVQVIQDEICKYVLQNSQTHNVYVFSLTLRMVFDLFVVVKQHLKIQLEVFFTSIHLRVGNSGASSFGQKELVLESLKEFCIEPSLIAGLYRNYDCEVGSTNLFEDLCVFLSKHATPTHRTTPNRLNILALECLLAVVESIAKRFCGDDDDLHYNSAGLRISDSASRMHAALQGDRAVGAEGDSGVASEDSARARAASAHQIHRESQRQMRMSPEEEQAVLQSRANKKNLTLAAARFNAEGARSFPYLCSLSILPDPVRAGSVVDFFTQTPGLDGVKVGEFLGGNKQLNVSVLSEFVDRFDFAAQGEAILGVPQSDVLSLDDALRAFLHHFKLPVESQEIGACERC